GKMADASLLLADELIAAKLNLLNGSNPCPIDSTIEAADSLIGNQLIPITPKITPSSALGQQMIALAATLAHYKSGLFTRASTPKSRHKKGEGGELSNKQNKKMRPPPLTGCS